MKRRRANVLFVLVLVAGCSLFLAATTKAEAMLCVFGVAFVALCGYVYVLGQIRQREVAARRADAAAVRARCPSAPSGTPRCAARPTARRRGGPRDRWSHAV